MKLQGDVFENRKIWLNRREKKKKLKCEGKEESGSEEIMLRKSPPHRDCRGSDEALPWEQEVAAAQWVRGMDLLAQWSKPPTQPNSYQASTMQWESLKLLKSEGSVSKLWEVFLHLSPWHRGSKKKEIIITAPKPIQNESICFQLPLKGKVLAFHSGFIPGVLYSMMWKN